MSRIRANQITNQSADGAPTVQNGLVISGVTTSTTFSGSGASLTNLPSAQLTGALPALDGSNLTGITQTTINNNANNRLITGSGTANTLEGESTLTFDGNTLQNLQTNAAANLTLKATSNSFNSLILDSNRSADTQFGIIDGRWNGNVVNRIQFVTGSDASNKDDGYMAFHTRKSGESLAERLRINTNGAVGINTIVNDQPNAPSLHVHGSGNDDCRISFSTPTKSNPGSRIGYYGLSNRFGMDVYNGFEIRDVAASYATRLKIDNNGYMTTNQPYGHLRFEVENDTGSLVVQSNVNTADIQNGMSHNGSGRLTVPVAGKYLIMIGCNILDDSQMQFRLRKNGSDVYGTYFQNSMSDSGWKSGSRTTVLPLSANDYLQTVIQGKQDGPAWNHFTVYLLG